MSAQDSHSPNASPDKTIVQRRVAHSGDQSRAAVKNLRAGLGSKKEGDQRLTGGFVADILKQHAKTQKPATLAVLGLFLIGAGFAQFSLPLIFVGSWFAVGVGICVAGILFARQYLSKDPEELTPQAWERNFQILQLLAGLVWAAIFAIHPLHSAEGAFSILTFSGAMVITALSLLSARYLKYGVLVAASPLIAVVVGRLVMDIRIPSIGMALLLIATLFFFQKLGDIMRNAHIDHLKSRAERDQLIMELEASRSISEEARRRAEEANLAKSRFLATMSHELRTPLNAILGFSEVMTNEVMGPINNDHYKEYLGDIHRSGAHLLKLINEILDLSRVEAGRYDLNEEATNLAHAAEESQQMIKLKASEKNVALMMQIQPDMPQIWADARAVRQVILNLLSNALKFTPPGGTIWLKVGWTAGGGQYVSIKDTGPGIAEEEIPIVLSSFGQGSIAIKSAEQGTGLGLPIVQALVHMHDGTFDLKSKLREGTEVVATFPKARVMEVMPAMPVDDRAGGRSNSRFIGSRRQTVAAPPMTG